MVRNVANWHEYLLHKAGIRRRDRFLFRIRGGPRAEVVPETLFTFKELFFTDDYFRGLPRGHLEGRRLRVVDVGANVGYFSLAMFARRPDSSIVAVEPVEANFALLRRNRELNPALDWTLVRKAVASRAGSLVLRMSPEDAYTTDASVLANPRGDKRVEVEAVELGEILEAQRMEEVDYLKLDVEGAEYDILYGCSRPLFRRVRTIVVETHAGPGERENKGALREHLAAQGYAVRTDRGPMIWAWR